VLTAVLLGFFLGLRHAFDPDHVIAVSTLVARHRSAWVSTWVGISWGIGHSLTIFAVGFLVIALRIAIPAGVSTSLELCVGLLLVALGIANLAAAMPGRGREAPAPGGGRPLGQILARSSLIGLAHGLAGSAAVALLATAAMPTPAAALVYLAVFGLGTVAGMTSFTLALGTPFAFLGPAAPRLVTVGTGLASLLFGGYVIWEIGAALPALA